MVHNDVWYAIDVPSYNFGIVSTCNMAQFNTRIAVYSLKGGSLQMTACNDDNEFCMDGTSEVFCDFMPGINYIRIGSSEPTISGSGSFRLEVFKGH